MASAKWGTGGGACTMTPSLQSARASLLPGASSALILTRSQFCCSSVFLLPLGQATICSRKRRRRCRRSSADADNLSFPKGAKNHGAIVQKRAGTIASMQYQQDGDEEQEMELQRVADRFDDNGGSPNTLGTISARSPSKDRAQPSSPELQCFGTGLDVECVIPKAHDTIAAASASTTTDGTIPAKSSASPMADDPIAARSSTLINMAKEMPPTSDEDQTFNMECIGTGTDVECVVPTTNGSISSSNKIAARAVSPMKNKETSFESFIDLPSERTFLVNHGEQHQQQSSSMLSLKGTWEFLVLISPFLFWGTAMVAMKGVLPKAGPLFVAATRLIPSGFLLIAFARFQNRKQPSGLNAWLAISLFALVDAACFQGFLAEGLKRTSAGLGSVIIDSQPLTVAVLASLLFGESIGALGILGLATGVLGLLLLEVPSQVIEDFLKGHGLNHMGEQSALSTSMLNVNNWSLWDSGEWWMLLAAQSMAVGTVMVRWLCQFSDPVMATGWHMVLGGIPLLALASIQHDPALSGHLQDLELVDWLALLYTSVFGSAVSYGVFFYNASRGSLTKLSSLTFLTPMFAALFGYILLEETLNPTQIVGACVTLASIYLINLKASTNN